MIDLRIGSIILFVKDLDRMASFYRDVIGLQAVTTDREPSEFQCFGSDSCMLCLSRIPEQYARNIVIANPPQPREDTPIKFVFAIVDVENARNEWIARGARMGALQRSGAQMYCDGIDPEGNVFQVSNVGMVG